MVNTPNLALPLLSPSQAQKHVTVNDALVRLDAITNLRILALDVLDPPTDASDGDSYIIPESATGEWEDRSSQVAVFSNGGWLFLLPQVGWDAVIASTSLKLTFDGVGWVQGALAVSGGGAGFGLGVVETDHVITSGTTNQTSALIPARAMVVGITARVIGTLSGGLTSWKMGVSGADDRYGSGLGLTLNSYAHGLTGAPVTYWADTEVVLSAEGGAFDGGQIRIAVHYLQIEPPRAV